MKTFIAKNVFGNKLFADHADPKFRGFHSFKTAHVLQSLTAAFSSCCTASLGVSYVVLSHTTDLCSLDFTEWAYFRTIVLS
jgi:hypothetical protein